MSYGYAEYVPLIKALADETRLKIIDMLSGGELCACKIPEPLSITQPTLSYHMKILTECGAVSARRSPDIPDGRNDSRLYICQSLAKKRRTLLVLPHQRGKRQGRRLPVG